MGEIKDVFFGSAKFDPEKRKTLGTMGKIIAGAAAIPLLEGCEVQPDFTHAEIANGGKIVLENSKGEIENYHIDYGGVDQKLCYLINNKNKGAYVNDFTPGDTTIRRYGEMTDLRLYAVVGLHPKIESWVKKRGTVGLQPIAAGVDAGRPNLDIEALREGKYFAIKVITNGQNLLEEPGMDCEMNKHASPSRDDPKEFGEGYLLVTKEPRNVLHAEGYALDGRVFRVK